MNSNDVGVTIQRRVSQDRTMESFEEALEALLMEWFNTPEDVGCALVNATVQHFVERFDVDTWIDEMVYALNQSGAIVRTVNEVRNAMISVVNEAEDDGMINPDDVDNIINLIDQAL